MWLFAREGHAKESSWKELPIERSARKWKRRLEHVPYEQVRTENNRESSKLNQQRRRWRDETACIVEESSGAKSVECFWRRVGGKIRGQPWAKREEQSDVPLGPALKCTAHPQTRLQHAANCTGALPDWAHLSAITLRQHTRSLLRPSSSVPGCTQTGAVSPPAAHVARGFGDDEAPDVCESNHRP